LVDSPNSFPEYIEYVFYEFAAPGAGSEYCGWLQVLVFKSPPRVQRILSVK